MEFIPKNEILQFLPDTLVTVRTHYNLDKTRMSKSVDILQDWLQKQPHLIKKDFTRRYLEVSIISCKGSIEKAKKQIDKLCTLKTLLPKFFMHCDIETDLAEITQLAYCIPLPIMTKDHLRVYIIKLNAKECTSTRFMEFYRLNVAVCEYLKAHDYVNGFVIIEDLLDINLADILANINFVELQQYMTILTEGFGARLLGIHMMTQSKLIDVFVKAISQFLTPKISSRIHVHNNKDSLHQILDEEILPVEYGGKERSLKELRDNWITALSSDEHKEYMKDILAARTNERYRLVDKFNEEYLGMPGSFRTLNVD